MTIINRRIKRAGNGCFGRRSYSFPLLAVAAAALCLCTYLFTSDFEEQVKSNNNLRQTAAATSSISNFIDAEKRVFTLDDETNVKIPSDMQGKHMTLEERVRYLELKTNAFMNFGTDPFFGVDQKKNTCSKMSDLTEFGCKIGRDEVKSEAQVKDKCPGLFDHSICLDGLPKPGTKYEVKDEKPPCLIYDFGIRAQPQFGATMARDFGCEVHGFDPSPVSTDWWDSDDAKSLRDLPNYHFHPYGAGGTDGVVTLKEYNWGQVSILRYNSWQFDCEGKDEGSNCGTKFRDSKSFNLDVKTLPTIIKELGHEGRTIDVLKVDVEGSEYAFLENILDSTNGCPEFINQITLEWHHFSWDMRYGEGSNPSMNAISTLLHTCGLKLIWRYSEGGWPAPEKIYRELGMHDVRYNLATYLRTTDDEVTDSI